MLCKRLFMSELSFKFTSPEYVVSGFYLAVNAIVKVSFGDTEYIRFCGKSF